MKAYGRKKSIDPECTWVSELTTTATSDWNIIITSTRTPGAPTIPYLKIDPLVSLDGGIVGTKFGQTFEDSSPSLAEKRGKQIRAVHTDHFLRTFTCFFQVFTKNMHW